MILCFKDKIIKSNLIASAVINFLVWSLLYIRIPIQVEPIILRYNIYVGISLIGPWYNVFYLSLFGLLVIILNLILAIYFYTRDKLVAHFLVTTATVCQIFLLILCYLLVNVNV